MLFQDHPPLGHLPDPKSAPEASGIQSALTYAVPGQSAAESPAEVAALYLAVLSGSASVHLVLSNQKRESQTLLS